jgi:hypothetical protein
MFGKRPASIKSDAARAMATVLAHYGVVAGAD